MKENTKKFTGTPIECIGLDADDTLWENEAFYLGAEQCLVETMSYCAPQADILSSLYETESGNMERLGYGAKAMTISLVETAIKLDPKVSSDKILRIIDSGKHLLDVPTELFPNVLKTIRALEKKYRIVIITKGELNEQNRKIRNSPFRKSMEYYVLENKTKEIYRSLFKQLSIDIKRFVMVGNSPKSDILPILELGGRAVYIPQSATWAHEMVELPESTRLRTLKHFGELSDVLL